MNPNEMPMDPNMQQMPPQSYHDDRMPIMSQEQPDSSIIYQLDAEQICLEIEHSLMGEKFDVEENKWYLPKGSKAIMKKEGIDYIMGEIRKRVNRNTFLSYLTEETIENMCSDLHKTLTDVMILNWEKWSMDKTLIRPTVYGVMDTVHIALRRSLNKTTLDYLKKATQVVENIRREGGQKKGFGIF